MEKCSNSWNFKDKQDTEDQQKDSEVMCLLQYIFWDWWDRTGAVHASTDYRQGIGYIMPWLQQLLLGITTAHVC